MRCASRIPATNRIGSLNSTEPTDFPPKEHWTRVWRANFAGRNGKRAGSDRLSFFGTTGDAESPQVN